jgi:hypothetical protein
MDTRDPRRIDCPRCGALSRDNCASRRPAIEYAIKNAADDRASQRNFEARTEVDLIQKANIVGVFRAPQSSGAVRGCW